MKEPLFLTLEEILAIHEHQIRTYGGAFGLRDLNLLESARANAEATFAGNLLHETLAEAAAAYLFGICRNHPFLDGNKRTALACALAFLRLNGSVLRCDANDLYDLVMDVASGRISKAAVAVFLERSRVNRRS